ncbi:MAG: DNA repair protein RecO [Ruminococcaceae bacterium]|nr:DNA repair protein RecO [Oscillospiraceae bacterium]
MKFKTNGLIIKEQNIREQDKLVTVLTDSHGIIRAFVRRAKNIKSPKCAATGLLCYSKLSVFENKGTYTIDEAQSIEMFIKLRNNVRNMSLAQYFCELSMTLCPKEADANDYLRLILNALHLLANEKKDPLLIKACVEMRLMLLCGYMPDLVMCDSCGTYESEQMAFIPKTGKLLCQSCAQSNGARGISASKSVITALRHTIYADFDKLFSFSLSDDSLRLLNVITESYLSSVTEKDFLTLQFFKMMEDTP